MYNTIFSKPNEKVMEKAKELILSGEVVAIPTETVYGLCANAFDENAVRKIFKAKGRPQDNPLIVHIASLEQLELIAHTNSLAITLAKHFWPGPLTMVLKKKDCISHTVSGKLDTVGVRMPKHQVTLDLIKMTNTPISAPSANISGKPSPTKASHVYDDFNGKIPMIIDGGDCEVGVESTVIEVLDDKITVLRPGAVTVNMLSQYCNNIEISKGVLNQILDNEPVSSPGLKYKHYAPKADITILDGHFSEFCEYVYKNGDENTAVLVFEGEENLFQEIKYVYTYGLENDSLSQANKLFDVLRQIDKNENIKTVFARMPEKTGVGLAVYNRLIRACGFNVIKLKKAYIIGLTGQTGSGKSTVCKTLLEHNIAVIDCDKISREVINEPHVLQKLTEFFGRGILYNDNTLNRKELGLIAFSNEENLIYLNHVMYPEITKVIKEKIEILKDCNEVIVLDAPTLFESKADILCDTTVAVIADKDVRLERIINRDNLTKEEAIIRMNAQHENEFYIDKCKFVIKNDGDLKLLASKAVQIIDSIKQEVKKTTQI